MPMFRKKPVVIEARKLTAESARELCDWMNESENSNLEQDSEVFGNAIGTEIRGLWITTLEGNMEASVGDWIIRGVAGEFYPCKPDIFEATYDAVNWSATDQIPISMAESEQLLVERLAEFQERGE